MDNSDQHETQALGAQIRRLRSLKRMTVADISRATEIDEQELLAAESGQSVSALLLSRVAIALGLPVEAFFHCDHNEVSEDWRSDAQIFHCLTQLKLGQKRELAAFLTDLVDDASFRRDWRSASGSCVDQRCLDQRSLDSRA